MNDLQIILKPTQNDTNEAEEWLEAEYKATRKGFYTDRDVLDQSFRDKTLILLKMRGKVVSFIAWKYYVENTAKISIAETHPDFRKKGLSRMLLDALIRTFQKKGILAIDLQSISIESETAWKHLGFTEFPEDKKDRRSEEKELFKVIVPVMEISTLTAAETLELWHMDTHEISDLTPNAGWNLSFIDGSRNLKQSIVYPIHYDWHIRWKKNGAIVYEGRVKRFPTQISFGRFMIVKSLP